MGRIVGATWVLAALLAAGSASAQSAGTDLIPWPQALPPAEVPSDVQARPVEHCRDGGVRCVDGLRRRLRRQFERFDAACDHRAVIAYSTCRSPAGCSPTCGARAPAWSVTAAGWAT